MNTDDRFASYFTARAPEIPVAGLDTPAIATRAQRRRHRRNGVKVGAVVAVLAVGGAFLATNDDPGQPVASEGATATEPLEWAVAPSPVNALGQSLGAVTSGDGSLYEISTAPGAQLSGQTVGPRHLYRSTDAVTWEGVALPDGFSASGLASSGDRIYALGTSPAGGGAERVTLASGTGDGAWNEVALPLDLEGMAAAFPGTLNASTNRVAVKGDGSVVASVSVNAVLDPSQLAVDLGSENYEPTEAGVDVYATACDGGGGVTTTTTAVGTPAGEVTSAEPPCDPDAEAGIERSYSWAELGVDPEIGRLAAGRLFVFAGPAEGSLEEVAQVASIWWASDLLASAEGYWLVYGEREPAFGDPAADGTMVLHSVDGVSWNFADAARVDGSLAATGMLGGRPSMVTRLSNGRPLLHTFTLGGVQTTDVLAHAQTPASHTTAAAAAIGPLGLALVVSDVGSPDQGTVLLSSDGSTFVGEPLPASPDGRFELILGVSVSADAVTVRLSGFAPDAPRGADPDRRLFVGTPR